MTSSTTTIGKLVSSCDELLNIANLKLPRSSPGLEHLCEQLAARLAENTGLPKPNLEFINRLGQRTDLPEYCGFRNTISIPYGLSAERSAEIVFRSFAQIINHVRAISSMQKDRDVGKAYEREQLTGFDPELIKSATTLGLNRADPDLTQDLLIAASIIEKYAPLKALQRIKPLDEFDYLRTLASKLRRLDFAATYITLEAKRLMVAKWLSYAEEEGSRLAGRGSQPLIDLTQLAQGSSKLILALSLRRIDRAIEEQIKRHDELGEKLNWPFDRDRLNTYSLPHQLTTKKTGTLDSSTA
jgi:hypothetical protein